jgi:ferritin
LIKLISDNLTEVLNTQLGAEKFNANLYLGISGLLKNRGFENLAGLFLKQHEEETEHSLILFNLLTDLNSLVDIPEIDKPNFNSNSILDIATAYLEREVMTTTSLHEIEKLAIDESCPVVEERMREMIKLQQNEYAEATDFMDKAELTGGDWWKVMVWDLGLGD